MKTRPFSTILRRSALAAVAVTTLAAPPAEAQEGQRYTLSGRDVAVYNLAGTVEVVAARGDEVTVDVWRRGADAGALQVETGPVRGRESLRVVYPADEIVYPEMGRWSETHLRVRDDGTFGDGSDRGWFDDRVEISGAGGGMEAYADLRIAVPAGRRFSVYLGAGKVSVENVDGEIRVDAAAAPVAANGVTGRLWVDTGSGSVTVRDVDGVAEIDTGSGSVEVAGIRGPELIVDTGSGSVRASDIRAEDVTIDTGSGRIEVADISADVVELDTGSGSVDVGLLSDVRSLRVDTGSGGVTLTVPADLGADLEIDTGSGGIDLDVPVQAFKMERSYFRGRLGDGGGRIEIDTGSGSVRLVRS